MAVSAATANPGLTPAEAALRLRRFGPNRLVARERWAAARQLLETLADPMAIMLAVAGSVYLALGEMRDGVILLAALVPVLGVDVLLELRSRRALRKLAAAAAPRARVVRAGSEMEIPSAELVPGDVLLLREGDVIPADGVLHADSNLSVDESQLTGEAEPIAKSAAQGDRQFHAGSLVMAGSGIGEVTATGSRTRYGTIAALVARSADEVTPLQRKTAHLVRVLGIVAGAVALGVFALGLLRGAPLSQAFLGGLGVAMAAIPEEFPLVFAIFLSLGAWRLSGKGVLV
ncbi:MAG TPA: HAD-IC family P-type ATPase, partial [Myxococcales bacterium]|nr:HAD-IC family P-type ATPase [Myxococcales bacterium]